MCRDEMRQVILRLSVTLLNLVVLLTVSGCVAQADMKNAERRSKESNEALAQRLAQQRQEVEELKSQELPKLRGQLEKVQHQAQEIQRAQDDLWHRSAALDQQTRRLDAESANRYAQVRESLNAQDVKNKTDRDQLQSELLPRLDALDGVIGNILLRMEEFEKRLKALDKK
jgi:hypothetical protein